MKKIILFIFAICVIGCQQTTQKKSTPNMEYGGFSGTSDDTSKESNMTRELMAFYLNNEFDKAAYMMSDDGAFYFNADKFDKAGWVGAAALHHSLFDSITSSKIQPPIVTTSTYDNGEVWSQAWFWWSGKGKATGTQVDVPVHHAFRFENEHIVAAYHFFDPTLFNAEIQASKE